MDLPKVVDAFVAAALEGGRAILALAAQGMCASRKPDGSPVTPADLAAEEVIRARLAETLPEIAIIGEEGDLPSAGALPDPLILVDPLDGTRDFVEGSGEFTVNIALICDGRAAAGVVHAPALGRLFAGSLAHGAFEMRIEAGDGQAAERGAEDRQASRRPIAVREASALRAARARKPLAS